MTKQARALYFHGGPGFNGNPERSLLTDLYKQAGIDLKAWDEPSVQRPNGPLFCEQDAYKNYLDQAEQFFLSNYDGEPLVLIGHSYGSFPVCYLAKLHPEKVLSVVFVAPDLCLSVTDKRMLTIAMEDFKKHGNDLHLELQKVLDQYTGRFDVNEEKGMNLLVQNPRIFDYYWFNKERMAAFFAHYNAPLYGFDMSSFLAVRRSMFDVRLNASAVPAAVIFGRHEVIVSPQDETALLREYFLSLNVYELSDSAHYPHIERAEKVLQIILDEIKRDEMSGLSVGLTAGSFAQDSVSASS